MTSTNPETATVDLQKSIDEMTRWCADKNMQANAKKSVTLTLSNIHNNFALELDSFHMNGETMANNHNAKFIEWSLIDTSPSRNISITS